MKNEEKIMNASSQNADIEGLTRSFTRMEIKIAFIAIVCNSPMVWHPILQLFYSAFFSFLESLSRLLR